MTRFPHSLTSWLNKGSVDVLNFKSAPWINAESLHFSHILIGLFKIHCDVYRGKITKAVFLSKNIWTWQYTEVK